MGMSINTLTCVCVTISTQITKASYCALNFRCMNATKVHGVQSVSLLLAFVESVWVVLSAPPKMLLLCLKGIIGQKVTLFKKVQLVVMFLGAASILLLQVSRNVISTTMQLEEHAIIFLK